MDYGKTDVTEAEVQRWMELLIRKEVGTWTAGNTQQATGKIMRSLNGATTISVTIMKVGSSAARGRDLAICANYNGIRVTFYPLPENFRITHATV